MKAIQNFNLENGSLVSTNNICEKGTRLILKALKKNTTLEYLDLYFNAINEKLIEYLVKKLSTKTALIKTQQDCDNFYRSYMLYSHSGHNVKIYLPTNPRRYGY